MDVGSINGVPFKEATSNALGGSASLAENFDNFLTLLTTQLRHQDPLSPLDTNEFTQQLVSFSAVEQAINTNKKLDAMLALQGGNQLSSAVPYIGRDIEAESPLFMLQDGSATITYGFAATSAETTITIVDDEGHTVRTITGETAAGFHKLIWDGKDDLGNDLPEGIYRANVVAVDAEDKTISTVTGTIGRVTGVEVQDGELILLLGELPIPFDKVVAVKEPSIES